MRVLTKEELQEIIDKHRHWLNKDCEGWESMKADLRDADLKGANLKNADLTGADLKGTDLSYVDLSYACLNDVDLRDADLKGANLEGIVMRNTDLRNAKLSYANLKSANLRNACLNNADLSGACLNDADLGYAKLRNANLSITNLCNAELYNADMSNAKLRCTNLSNATNILSPINYLMENFKFVTDGIIAYKTFNGSYRASEKWVIQKGSVITENCNPNRTEACGCGINVAPLEWIKRHYTGDIWKVLIRWEWLAGVIVPYNTDGKIRCEKCELLEIV